MLYGKFQCKKTHYSKILAFYEHLLSHIIVFIMLFLYVKSKADESALLRLSFKLAFIIVKICILSLFAAHAQIAKKVLDKPLESIYNIIC